MYMYIKRINVCAIESKRKDRGRREGWDDGFRGEYTRVLKCKRHKIYLKVKYESSGASVGGNQRGEVGGPSHTTLNFDDFLDLYLRIPPRILMPLKLSYLANSCRNAPALQRLEMHQKEDILYVEFYN